MYDFKQFILGQWHVDEEYELYLEAWLAYYRAADLVDGHLPFGLPEAVEAGKAAMESVFNKYNRAPLAMHDRNQKWQHAKVDACRMTDKQKA